MSSFLPQTTPGGRRAYPGEPGGGLEDRPYGRGLGQVFSEGAFTVAWFELRGPNLTADRIRYFAGVLEQLAREAGWSLDKTVINTETRAIRLHAQVPETVTQQMAARQAAGFAESAADPLLPDIKVVFVMLEDWVPFGVLAVQPSTAILAPASNKFPWVLVGIGGAAAFGLFFLLRR